MKQVTNLKDVLRMPHRHYLVLGGDLRSLALYHHLLNDGQSVSLFGFDHHPDENHRICHKKSMQNLISQADVIIAPIPCTSSEAILNTPFHTCTITMTEILETMQKDQIFVAGRIPASFETACSDKEIRCTDLLQQEELAVLNAIPTAEGAIQAAMENMKVTLHDSNTLILGFGRIGKILARMLQGLGANVFVAARKPADFAWMKSYGYQPVEYSRLDHHLEQADVVFNTVPHVLLKRDHLKHMNKSCMVIELASKPYGVDFEIAKEEGIDVILASSLPGKVAPVTAARYIKETVYRIVSESGGNA